MKWKLVTFMVIPPLVEAKQALPGAVPASSYAWRDLTRERTQRQARVPIGVAETAAIDLVR